MKMVPCKTATYVHNNMSTYCKWVMFAQSVNLKRSASIKGHVERWQQTFCNKMTVKSINIGIADLISYMNNCWKYSVSPVISTFQVTYT